jgi:pyruvate/2-oxoglutarate dehydrogenase complex dihydrolipoamide acyltransferase (E2) component
LHSLLLQVLEVETETLVEDAYRLDDFAGKVTLLIEANEEAWLAKQLVPEGSELPVGTPIALLCEEQNMLQEAAQQAAAAARIKSVYRHEAESGQSIRTMVWQSYLKESNKQPGSNCGCM